MKAIALHSVLALGVFGIGALATLPAAAQFVSIPVSNGSFALSGTGTGTTYSSPLTLLSPAGTINLTSYPLPSIGTATLVTTSTPIGTYFSNVSGSATLNDGRTATFSTGEGYLKLESLATVTGAESSIPVPTDLGVTVTYSVQTGSLVIPGTTVSAYSTPQVSIPLSGGSFSINASTTAGADTVTVNSVLTPMGTANLTLTFPDLSLPGSPDILLDGTSQSVLIHGIANGTVTLNDGQVATVSDRMVTLTGTATRGTGADFWYGEDVPATATTIQGTITGGSISVPQTAVNLPTVPPVEPPVVPPVEPPVVPPTQPSTPTQPVQPTQPQPPAATQPTPTQPTPIADSAPKTTPTFELGFAEGLNLGGEPAEFTKDVNLSGARTQPIPEVEISSLQISRIHPGLQANK